MKLILNDSTLEITSREKENRHKVQNDGWSIGGQNTWNKYPNCTAFFIDIKNGDNIVITPKSGHDILVAFTTDETNAHNQAVSFASFANGRIKTSNAYQVSATENCYLWVQEIFNSGASDVDFEPDSIVINGLTLDENGYL
jgi:hypothetical protein